MNSPPLLEKSKKGKAKGKKAKGKSPEEEGLCATCNNAPGCTLKEGKDGPVYQCEEFDGYQPAPAKIEPIAAPKKGNGKEARQYKGLCVNCEHRETCAHADLEGGVWHCENYE
jgi:hypothetical protein